MRCLVMILLGVAILCPMTSQAIEVSGDQWGIWTRDNSPYNVVGEIRVPPESTLVIEPGVLVNFQGHYKFIVDSLATLLAQGTETDSIYFTTEDMATGWHGLRFSHADRLSRITYCCLEYGKATGNLVDAYGRGGAIYCNASNITISNSRISHNSAVDPFGYGGGIACEYCSPTIVGSCISDNYADEGGGLFFRFCSSAVADNTIERNSSSFGAGICCYDSGRSQSIIGNIISGNVGSTGGGLYLSRSSATISHNIFSGNSAAGGGAIACEEQASPAITDNLITNNSVSHYGAAIHCFDRSRPTIANNMITDNEAGASGGGVNCQGASSAAITDNIIRGNSAVSNGGGICASGSSYLSVVGNTFTANSAGWGGAIYCSNSSAVIIGNVVSSNSATLGGGGGISCLLGSSPALTSNTVSSNSASYGGGLYCMGSSNPVISNTVLWGDIAPYGAEIYRDQSSHPSVNYCDVQRGWAGQGNVDADPMFVGPEREDFHLRWHSPCIDAGVPDSLDPDGTRSDIGAFYFNQAVLGIVELYPQDTPIVIPPEGGDIVYDGWIFNFRGHVTRADVWTYVFAPRTGRYGPLDLYENIRIPADSLGRNQISQHVPGVAPKGNYVLAAYVGDYPNSITDSSYFYFSKSGSIGEGVSDWSRDQRWLKEMASTTDGVPTSYLLSQNYPNPFNASTMINYQLPHDAHVKLEVYNLMGEKVATLVDSRQQPGCRSVAWNASEVSSGLYFYKLTAGDFTETKRMLLLK